MVFNPDASKFVVKVIRGKAVLVDKQILRWRKKSKKKMQTVEPFKKRRNREVKAAKKHHKSAVDRITKLLTGEE